LFLAVQQEKPSREKSFGGFLLTTALGVVELSGKWNSASVARAVSWETSGGFFFVWTRLLARQFKDRLGTFHVKQIRHDP
jgi:hypothetical protein